MSREGQHPGIGLALAGGGPEGAVYEIGALRALDEAIDGLDLNALSIYVGVSAGGFIAANLANQLTTAQMCRAILKEEPGEHPFLPETFLQPLQMVSQWNRTGPLNSDTRYDFVECRVQSSIVNGPDGRPTQLIFGDPGFIDYYGRPWAQNWEEHFEKGWEKPEN